MLIVKKGDNYYFNQVKMAIYDDILKMSEGAEDGWGKAYYHVIPSLIEKYNFKTGAEVGVAYGGHSDAILTNTKLDLLYSIDPYSLEHDNTDGYFFNRNGKIEYFTQKDYEELNAFAQTRLKNKHHERSEFLRLSSHAAFSYFHFNNILLDFVFIDARHRYEDLYTDIFLWKEVIKKGGMISGHDYGHESYPGIKEAVDQWFDKVNVEDGNVWWVKLDDTRWI